MDERPNRVDKIRDALLSAGIPEKDVEKIMLNIKKKIESLPDDGDVQND